MKNKKIIEDYLELESHPILGNHALINNQTYSTYIAEASTLEELWTKIFSQFPSRICSEYLICWRTNPVIRYNNGIFTIRFRMAFCKKTDNNISHSPLNRS